MTPTSIQLQADFHAKQETLNEAREAYLLARDSWYAELDRINAIFEPTVDTAYNFISRLADDESLYVTKLPRELYEDYTKHTPAPHVSRYKFGRMMNEMGFKRSSKRTPEGVQARWRLAE